MKGFRFYAEMGEDQRSKSASKKHHAFTRANLADAAARGTHVNCVAVTRDKEGAMADNYISNSPHIVWGSAAPDYPRKRCVRVSEALARRLHPRLFHYLERPTPGPFLPAIRSIAKEE